MAAAKLSLKAIWPSEHAKLMRDGFEQGPLNGYFLRLCYLKIIERPLLRFLIQSLIESGHPESEEDEGEEEDTDEYGNTPWIVNQK